LNTSAWVRASLAPFIHRIDTTPVFREVCSTLWALTLSGCAALFLQTDDFPQKLDRGCQSEAACQELVGEAQERVSPQAEHEAKAARAAARLAQQAQHQAELAKDRLPREAGKKSGPVAQLEASPKPTPMTHKAVTLPEELQRFAEAEVQAGRFTSVDEVVRHAVTEFRKLESLRQDFRNAREEFARGEGVELTSEGLLAHMRRDRSKEPVKPSH
jgi:putative addiction module CopG family antidote